MTSECENRSATKKCGSEIAPEVAEVIVEWNRMKRANAILLAACTSIRDGLQRTVQGNVPGVDWLGLARIYAAKLETAITEANGAQEKQ